MRLWCVCLHGGSVEKKCMQSFIDALCVQMCVRVLLNFELDAEEISTALVSSTRPLPVPPSGRALIRANHAAWLAALKGAGGAL